MFLLIGMCLGAAFYRNRCELRQCRSELVVEKRRREALEQEIERAKQQQ